ncbi:hypothetical protein LOTGIDRAFT_112352 [Lottia gigantea]|uniref:NAD(P)H oxidase (H2O2-forming) n=1 Tax=Lottia gigantea TaxID=225164 RepID=V4A9P6_LOTGI|nr:hypothetical protein LOTGIDRAFT_112352 [Lottia gigantea]ESP00714.1 hypothetical protein LOTGIDRAFT_112352 [Lottia gigantea]
MLCYLLGNLYKFNPANPFLNPGCLKCLRHAFFFFSVVNAAYTRSDEIELHPLNGYYNNLFNPDWGISGNQLRRLSPPDYSDGAYEPSGVSRPNPMVISDTIHNGPSGKASTTGRNALFVFFGQLVADEMISTGNPGCPPEYTNIPIPEGHKYRALATEMTYQRSGYNAKTGNSPNRPRQQQNGVTSFLDAGFLYGTTKFFTDQIREFRNGRLKASDQTSTRFPAKNDIRLPLVNAAVPRDHTLKPATRFFRIGNARGHMNPYLLSLQIVWYRWHNQVAEQLHAANTGWKDERIFTEARKRVTAHFQKIVINDWLKFLLSTNDSSPLPPYKGYQNSVHPGATQEFQVAMEAISHTMTPGGVFTLSDTCQISPTTVLNRQNEGVKVEAVRLCNTYWDPQDVVENNFESIIRGMVYTRAEKEDLDVVADIREYYPGPLEFSRRDQVAVTIQQGRDHGLPSYNTVRTSLRLSPLESWFDFSSGNSTMINALVDLFGTTDDLDLYTGGLLEIQDNNPGQLFRAIIVDQFTRIRDGDRFWYENPNNGLFTPTEIADINRITFSDILRNVTSSPGQILPDAFNCNGKDPPNIDSNNDTRYDQCSQLELYDYFSGSEVSFALSFLALFLVIPGSFMVLMLLIRMRKKKFEAKSKKITLKQKSANCYIAEEWLGMKSENRKVKVEFQQDRKKINVKNCRGQNVRFINLRQVPKIQIKLSYDKQFNLVLVRVPGEVDLILRFESLTERQEFVVDLEKFGGELNIEITRTEQAEKVILTTSNNRDDRQKILDAFFRVVCLQVQFFIELDFENEKSRFPLFHSPLFSEVINIKLTRTEFAEALGLQPSSIFVRNVFLLADKDKDGFLCFREFLDMFAIFARGSAEEKARLMFNVYDIKRKGILNRRDFEKMIKSLLDLSEAKLNDDKVKELIEVMYSQAGLNNRDTMNFDDFKKVFASDEYKTTFQSATLADQVNRIYKGLFKTKYNIYNDDLDSYPPNGLFNIIHVHYRGKREKGVINRKNRRSKVTLESEATPVKGPTGIQEKIYAITKYIEIYRLHIFWVLLYTLVTCGIFIERAYYYAEGREHAGLRRLSGAWTTAMIRGSASVIMFTYVSLLVTMCRNTITLLRETVLHRFIPFDSAVAFHKYIAVLAMIGTIVHIFGHAVNLYCVVTQPPQDVSCLFREYFRGSHEIATFHYWAYQTITGLAGVVVTIVIFIMYVFATQFARRNHFTAFWLTHSLYLTVYPLTILHGIGVLVQAPIFPYYLFGPLVLFVFDKLASLSRNRVEIRVKKVSILPSDVTELVFRRPANFDYRSGQWVRIACLKLGKGEYHPFTLTSAPHEENLSLHIRAVGPWTKNLRKIYEFYSIGNKPLPLLYVDGPFGEGHQDWFTFDVAVLVGGGIGVTPFASILKDIAFKSKAGIKINCKKVYFVWITRSQKHFEWLIDIIRDVEEQDVLEIVNVHIFITQFTQKYDLRTTMLYICERNFQKVENKSLFTGLRAVTHFGRPKMEDFLHSLHHEYPEVERFGVFSCGPGPMTNSVQAACTLLNSIEGPTYCHHFENF